MNIQHFLRGEYQFAELAVVGEPDRIIQGKNWGVACHRLPREGEQEPWFLCPFGIPVGRYYNPETDEEQIARAISLMLGYDFFINFISFEQVWHWILFRDNSREIALCFWSEQGEPHDALLKQLQDGQVDQFSYDYIWTEANIYKSLWELLKVKGEVIKQLCEKYWGYPFESSREFLIEVIREDLEGEFMACLRRRYIYNASQMTQIAKLKRKAHKGDVTKTERKKLYSLIDQRVPFSTWFNRFIVIASALAEKDDLAREHFDAYKRHLYTLAKLLLLNTGEFLLYELALG